MRTNLTIKKIQVLIAFICMISLSIFAQSDAKAAEQIEMKTLIAANYEVQYPANWDLDQSGQMGSTFFIFSPIEGATDQFRENINLMIQDLSGHNLDLDQYTQISEQQVKVMMEGAEILFSEKQDGQVPAFHKIIYKGKQGALDLKFEQYYWVINDKAYIVTLTCDVNTFDDYQKIGETILNSFKLK